MAHGFHFEVGVWLLCCKHTLIFFVGRYKTGIGISSGTITPWVCVIILAVCKRLAGKCIKCSYWTLRYTYCFLGKNKTFLTPSFQGQVICKKTFF